MKLTQTLKIEDAELSEALTTSFREIVDGGFEQVKPGHLAVCVIGNTITRRLKLKLEYKKARGEMPYMPELEDESVSKAGETLAKAGVRKRYMAHQAS